jgi:hypothetical protein
MLFPYTEQGSMSQNNTKQKEKSQRIVIQLTKKFPAVSEPKISTLFIEAHQ